MPKFYDTMSVLGRQARTLASGRKLRPRNRLACRRRRRPPPQCTGDRQPGRTITGHAGRGRRQCAGDPTAQLAYGSALMEEGKLVKALRALDVAPRLDPANPVPKAYGGWIAFERDQCRRSSTS